MKAETQLYGRLLGMYYWKCPKCGKHNRTHFTPHGYKMQCKNAQCRVIFWHGSLLGSCQRGGRDTPPRDMVMLCADVWSAGDPVNRVICASCSKIIFERGNDVDSTDQSLPVLLKPRKQRNKGKVE